MWPLLREEICTPAETNAFCLAWKVRQPLDNQPFTAHIQCHVLVFHCFSVGNSRLGWWKKPSELLGQGIRWLGEAVTEHCLCQFENGAGCAAELFSSLLLPPEPRERVLGREAIFRHATANKRIKKGVSRYSLSVQAAAFLNSDKLRDF